MPIRFFDMFAGIGGFRSGLEAIGGFQCVGYCEIDKYAKQAYEAIYDTGGEMYFADARKIKAEDLSEIDLICGGFPCQSFSIAGERGGFDDPRGTLFFEIARLAEVKRPKYLFRIVIFDINRKIQPIRIYIINKRLYSKDFLIR
jgi:DNA (cytosine-5)-methyltransferase 1